MARSYDRRVSTPQRPPGSSRALTVTLGGAAPGLSPAHTGPDAGADQGADEVVLTLGPHHPSNHGALRLRLRLDGERIAACEPEVGFVHRGAEKLFEARDYRQIGMLANRHDWLSAFPNELGVALAVERMLGIEVPTRAVWARTLLVELSRVLHHLAFVAAGAPVPGGLGPPVVEAAAARERLLGLLEELTGGRMHVMFARVGGLKEDLPAGWRERLLEAVEDLSAALPGVAGAFLDGPGFRNATRGVGVLPMPAALAYGVSGPVARASGVDLDLRQDDPSLERSFAYAALAEEGLLRRVTRAEGDAFARFEVLLEEVAVSLALVSRCATRLGELPRGPVAVRLPTIVKAPEGAAYAWTESPGGINGYYLVSRGEKTPWRLKLRTPGFNNAAALPVVLDGARVTDLVPVLASLFFVVGDIDK
jgi:NADH-quinone oxidoreductase subunit D